MNVFRILKACVSQMKARTHQLMQPFNGADHSISYVDGKYEVTVETGESRLVFQLQRRVTTY